MSSKVEDEVEAACVNGGGTDETARKRGGAVPQKEEDEQQKVEANGGSVEIAEDGEGEEEAEEFAAVMAQLAPEGVRALHARVEAEWGPVLQSACQTAAARALWSRAVRDPTAGVLAGERFLRVLHDKMRRDQRAGAREVHGVMIAVRTLWFDSRIEAAVAKLGGDPQVVLLGAGCSAVRMDSSAVEQASTGSIWSTPSADPRSISIGKEIFCNRSLNMKNITAVGFDMDYTLAQYKPETFEALAYHGTIEKLVKDLNYPEELLAWQFDWKYMVRGLVLDKKRGNILKMDRHKYVKVAYHGFRELTKEEKTASYGSTLIRDSFDEPDYALIDTLFSLGEAYLFAQLVDFMDNNPGKVPAGTDYPLMYRDVRSAVDLCHRDGTLKKMVAKDPTRYINEDLAIVPMLELIKKSGRSTFLVTNSLWDYTNVVMNYLCGPYTSDVGSGLNHEWLQYFDVVITGSSKPGFFHDDNRAGLFEVEPDSGKLLNADIQIGSPRSGQKHSKSLHKVYQGGNVGHLHRLLSIASSSQILYVGDHIYGDILRSKKVLGWRTMLVIPELEHEVKLLSESKATRKELRHLRMERDSIEDKIHRLEWSLKFDDLTEKQREKLFSEHDNLLQKREHVRCRHQEAQRQHHQKFHKVWGQLMKTGFQNSRFAHQVERFACLYSSQVTNFGLYSPNKYYRPSEDYMPHEFDVLGL